MSRGLNKVLIIGQLGRNPEMRYTPSGRPITTFNVGAHRSWNTSDGERRSEIEWFNAVAWSNLAEICKRYLSNCSLVFVEGDCIHAIGKIRKGTDIVRQKLLLMK